jgi:hypothetical protein
MQDFDSKPMRLDVALVVHFFLYDMSLMRRQRGLEDPDVLKRSNLAIQYQWGVLDPLILISAG